MSLHQMFLLHGFISECDQCHAVTTVLNFPVKRPVSVRVNDPVYFSLPSLYRACELCEFATSVAGEQV